MSPSASSARADFVVVGNPDSRRVSLFQVALGRVGLPPARLVAYADLLAGRASLGRALRPGSIVRIESPDRDFEVERAILVLGAEAEEPDGVEYERVPARAVTALTFDKGRILPSRQWYLGYCALLAQLGRHLEGCRVMSSPGAIAAMFDKRRSHALLVAEGIPVPPAIGPVYSYDELVARMRATERRRVFVKLAHGSSASGAVALTVGDDRQEATTTVEMVATGGERRLYNSRRIRTYRDPREIAALVDALCRQRVHVEQWMPKAGHTQHAFDLRAVTIAGRVRHVIARLSRSPMTNLHLLNQRGDTAAILEKIGAASWARARANCKRAAHSFDALYSGIDVLFTPDLRQHAILELNAFGDLLPGVLHDGQDTYEAEIRAMLEDGTT